MASEAVVVGEVDIAEDSSPRKTIIMEEEFVRKSRNVSAGLFRERCAETDRRKATNV
jgi:hypothetical protein